VFPASEAFHSGRPSDGGACHRLPLAMRRYYNADCLIRVHQRVRDVKRHIHSEFAQKIPREGSPDRITVNLAPADIRKEGASFDLPRHNDCRSKRLTSVSPRG